VCGCFVYECVNARVRVYMHVCECVRACVRAQSQCKHICSKIS